MLERCLSFSRSNTDEYTPGRGKSSSKPSFSGSMSIFGDVHVYLSIFAYYRVGIYLYLLIYCRWIDLAHRWILLPWSVQKKHRRTILLRLLWTQSSYSAILFLCWSRYTSQVHQNFDMEPNNHRISEKNPSSNSPLFGFKMVICQGVCATEVQGMSFSTSPWMPSLFSWETLLPWKMQEKWQALVIGWGLWESWQGHN